jgi:Arc/MetJ-type ribon-helix-helix transcriptional regulator
VNESSRDEVIRSLVQLIEADQEVRHRLRTSEAILRGAIKDIEEGVDIATAIQSAQAADNRQGVNDALSALELARHEVRLVATTAGLGEGMTIADLARAWGISRHLAARLAKEARGED